MEYDHQKLIEYFTGAPEDIALEDIDLERIPRHISCIMDGNGRWATARGLARTEGHKAGIVSLREVITAAVRLGVDVLSCVCVFHRELESSAARGQRSHAFVC